MKQLIVTILCVIVGIAGGALLSSVVHAGEPVTVPFTGTLSWIMPTQYVDGTPLTSPVTKVQIFVEYGAVAVPMIEIGAFTSYVYTANVPPSTQVKFRVAACIVDNCSSRSGVAIKTSNAAPPPVIVVPKVPRPPTNFRAN